MGQVNGKVRCHNTLKEIMANTGWEAWLANMKNISELKKEIHFTPLTTLASPLQFLNSVIVLLYCADWSMVFQIVQLTSGSMTISAEMLRCTEFSVIPPMLCDSKSSPATQKTVALTIFPDIFSPFVSSSPRLVIN